VGRLRITPGSGLEGDDAAQVVNSLRRLFKAIQEYSKAILARTGLSGPQVWALTVLEKEPGLSLGELSERLFAHPSTVSGIVDRLAERGAVLRVVDSADRRGIRLSLTALGRRILRKAPPPVQLGLRRALERMPATRLRELRYTLEEIVRVTVARQVDAPFFELDDPRPRARGRQDSRGGSGRARRALRQPSAGSSARRRQG
jgi:DNA-binding MarR family transcriptional regulator